jgi:AraC-like DNA-binding protein
MPDPASAVLNVIAMKRTPDQHLSSVAATPVAGVYATSTTSRRSFERHWHDSYGIGLLVTGGHVSASGRGVVEARAGQLLASNPGEVHDGRPLGDSLRSWRMIHIDPQVLLAMLRAPGELPAGDLEWTRPVFDDPALRAEMQALFHRLDEAPLPNERLGFEEAFARTCGLLARRQSTQALPDPADAPVHRARELLADRLADPPTLAELAAITGLSRFQLVRRFAAFYGLSPYAWLLRHRTERARNLIQRGLRLADAAAACGFADQGHMTRAFARHFGFTPGALRRAAEGRR